MINSLFFELFVKGREIFQGKVLLGEESFLVFVDQKNVSQIKGNSFNMISDCFYIVES